jgi:hypothetical protein
MADGTVLQFKADLKAFSDAVGVTVGAATQKISLLIHDGCIDKTPVDTGRARGSWGISLDTVGDFVLPLGEYGLDGGRARAQQRILRTLPKDPYHTVIIFNNISYLEQLNMGSSAQAAAGFVELTIAEVEAAVDGIIEEEARRQLGSVQEL